MDKHASDSHPVGIIGGSGLYELLDDAEPVTVRTPFGAPSDAVMRGRFANREVVFLARHGRGHRIPPHRVNYRANIWALASLGAGAILGSSAVGGLSPAHPADTFVVPDQLIDRTRGRVDTYFDDSDVQHLAFADPFCPGLRGALIAALEARDERFASTGTTVVIAGPRFSTRAESRGWLTLGADIINMTQYPEAALAAELGVGYASLSFVTDADTGHADGDETVTAEIVFARLTGAKPRITAVLADAITRIPADYTPRALVDPAASARVLALPADGS